MAKRKSQHRGVGGGAETARGGVREREQEGQRERASRGASGANEASGAGTAPGGRRAFDAGEAFAWVWRERETVALVLAVKALLIFFGAQAYRVLSNQTTQGARGWMEIWNRWDALHYMALAESGYTATGERSVQIAFFPLYPWLTRAFAFVLGDYLFAAFVVSGVCSVAAALLLKRLVESEYDERLGRDSVWFMLIFPTSYFLHIPYTESLMLSLTLGCFLAARRDNWAAAGILGALASLSRINGVLLAPALAVELFLRYRKTRRFEARWLWVFAVPLGFVGYLLLNKVVTGSAFTFMSVQQSHWFKSLTWPWVSIFGALGSTWGRAPSEAVMVGWQEFFFAMLGLALTVYGWVRLRPAYAVWMTGNWLLITSTSFLLSVPRYTLIMFPIFILFAMLSARALWRRLITAWSLLYFALFVGQYVRGHWAF